MGIVMGKKYVITRKRLRIASFVMFIIGAVFVLCALNNPTLGRTIHIGSFSFGAEQWRVCYGVYVIIMLVFFAASFLVKEGNLAAEKGQAE